MLQHIAPNLKVPSTDRCLRVPLNQGTLVVLAAKREAFVFEEAELEPVFLTAHGLVVRFTVKVSDTFVTKKAYIRSWFHEERF